MGGGLSAGEAFAEGWASSDGSAAGDVVDIVLDVLPSLEITLSSDDIHLEVSPSGSAASLVENDDDFEVSAATNNPTGYTLLMGAESTDLTRTAAYSDGSSISAPTIQTLAPLEGGYTESAFMTNRWGYRIGNGNYLTFNIWDTLKATTGTTTGDTTSIRFAAKVDMSTPAGSYANTLVFVAVANYVEELLSFIQDIDAYQCRELASDTTQKVQDRRDGNVYTVRFINGSCWMTQNLRIAPGTELTPEDSNVPANFTIPDSTDSGFDSITGYSTPLVHVPTESERGGLTPEEIGIWYNYAAATAGTITGDNNTDEAEYDICPKGWYLPPGYEFQYDLTGGIYQTYVPNTTPSVIAFEPVASGYFGNFQASGVGSLGLWWSSTAYDSSIRFYLGWYGVSGMQSGNYGSGRYFGRSVRCKTEQVK